MIKIQAANNGFFILGDNTLLKGSTYMEISGDGLVTIKSSLGETLVSKVAYNKFYDGDLGGTPTGFANAAALMTKISAVATVAAAAGLSLLDLPVAGTYTIPSRGSVINVPDSRIKTGCTVFILSKTGGTQSFTNVVGAITDGVSFALTSDNSESAAVIKYLIFGTHY